jgi:hypothetical protein
MKKMLFVTIFILTGFYAFCQDAFIDQLTGTVGIKQPEEASFKTAVKGDKLLKDTIIQTSFRSYAIIKIGGTMITVRPLTTLSLTEIQKLDETESLNVNIQAGRVRVEVKPAAGTKASTTLTSPSSVASVRGTDFEFDTNNLYVNEGTVSFVGNNGQNVLVNAGERSQVEQTGQVSNPLDEKNKDLMPPSPVGASDIDMTVSGSSGRNSVFNLGFEFK